MRRKGGGGRGRRGGEGRTTPPPPKKRRKGEEEEKEGKEKRAIGGGRRGKGDRRKRGGRQRRRRRTGGGEGRKGRRRGRRKRRRKKGRKERRRRMVVGCVTSHQHASVSQGRICSHNFTCCHTVVCRTCRSNFPPTQSQYTDIGPTNPTAAHITPGAWQGSHRSAFFKSLVRLDPQNSPRSSGNRTPDLLPSRRSP